MRSDIASRNQLGKSWNQSSQPERVLEKVPGRLSVCSWVRFLISHRHGHPCLCRGINSSRVLLWEGAWEWLPPSCVQGHEVWILTAALLVSRTWHLHAWAGVCSPLYFSQGWVDMGSLGTCWDKHAWVWNGAGGNSASRASFSMS